MDPAQVSRGTGSGEGEGMSIRKWRHIVPPFPHDLLLGIDLCDGLGKLRLAVSCLVAVDYTLGDSLVELAASSSKSRGSLILVALGSESTNLADVGLQLGLDGLVAYASLLVGQVTLLLRLNICHDLNSFVDFADANDYTVSEGSAMTGTRAWGTLWCGRWLRLSYRPDSKSDLKGYQLLAVNRINSGRNLCEPRLIELAAFAANRILVSQK